MQHKGFNMGWFKHLFERFNSFSSKDIPDDVSNRFDQSQADGVKEVEENELASLQDNSYAYDEEVTGANYDIEDSLDFQDEDRDGELRE